MAKNYLEVNGINIRDIVRVKSARMGLNGIEGMVTGIAHGPELVPYFRVRICMGTGHSTVSPWFKPNELNRLGDELYHLRKIGEVR